MKEEFETYYAPPDRPSQEEIFEKEKTIKKLAIERWELLSITSFH
jgi:hypothetical protein